MDNRPPESSKKYLDAEKRGIKILREAEFENLVRDKLGDPTYSLTGKPQAFTDTSPSKEELKVTPIKATGTEMWTDLYQPRTRGDLVGNEGLVNQLEGWLKDWDDIHIRGNKKTMNHGGGGGGFRGGAGGGGGGGGQWSNMPNVNAKAVLLSGPPGIGKTSAARIVCRGLGYEVLETNASDTRNKNSI